MNAVSFPDMISNNSTNIITDEDATLQNLKYLILSSKNTLFGDPYFGTNLKKLIFDRNNAVLRDIVIDDLFTAITTFMPQIRVERRNITVESSGSSLYINIRAQNLLDYSFDNYTINMLNVEEL